MSRPITHTMPDFSTILVVGSSTSFGAHDEEGLGWVVRFNQMLAKSHPEKRFICANAGISGHTSRDGYMNLVNNIGLHDPSYAIIALGTNDILVQEGLEPETPWMCRADSMTSHLNMIKTLKSHNIKSMIIGPQPVEQDVVRFASHNDDIQANTSFRYENSALKQLNDDIETICEQEKVAFLRLFEDWQTRKSLWTDGLHPNAKGHQLWAEQVYKKFVSLYL